MGVNTPTETFQLRRIHFVPARRPDVTPVPTGVDIIVLNGVLPVCLLFSGAQDLKSHQVLPQEDAQFAHRKHRTQT